VVRRGGCEKGEKVGGGWGGGATIFLKIGVKNRQKNFRTLGGVPPAVGTPLSEKIQTFINIQFILRF